MEKRKKIIDFFKTTKIFPDKKTNKKLEEIGEKPLNKQVFLSDLLKRPNIKIDNLKHFSEIPEIETKMKHQIENTIKYEGFIKRDAEEMEKYKNLSEELKDKNFNLLVKKLELLENEEQLKQFSKKMDKNNVKIYKKLLESNDKLKKEIKALYSIG